MAAHGGVKSHGGITLFPKPSRQVGEIALEDPRALNLRQSRRLLPQRFCRLWCTGQGPNPALGHPSYHFPSQQSRASIEVHHHVVPLQVRRLDHAVAQRCEMFPDPANRALQPAVVSPIRLAKGQHLTRRGTVDL